MTKKRQAKLVPEGEYPAEIDIEVLDTGEGWAPHRSLEDAHEMRTGGGGRSTRTLGRYSTIGEAKLMATLMTSAGQLIPALERAPGIVIPLVRQADPAIVKRRPPSGKWSIHEHACHLAAVHPLFFERLDLMLSQDNPTIRSYDPGRDDPQDALLGVNLDEALRRFTQDRARVVERLRELRPEEWHRPAQHDEYNSYSVFTMFRHLALHDFFHAYRIEELLLRKDWPPPSASWDGD